MKVLDSILLKEHYEAGLSLTEDDHGISLVFEGKEVALFNWHASISVIRNAAHQILEERKSGVTYCSTVK